MMISDPLLIPPRAKQRNVSPSHARDRPFWLNLAKNLTSEEKGKGKEANRSAQILGDSLETGSSAKKSLNLDSQAPASGEAFPVNLVAPILCDSQQEKKKSLFEITEEEEERERNEDPEAFLAKQFS